MPRKRTRRFRAFRLIESGLPFHCAEAGAAFVPLSALARDFFFAGFFMLFVDPADEAPLAEVSPAPLETPAPLAPGAIVSAFAAPADVDAFGVPAPCARTSGDADTARHRINCWKVRFNAISFSLG
jgi:hypothetical protein